MDTPIYDQLVRDLGTGDPVAEARARRMHADPPLPQRKLGQVKP